MSKKDEDKIKEEEEDEIAQKMTLTLFKDSSRAPETHFEGAWTGGILQRVPIILHKAYRVHIKKMRREEDDRTK